MTTDNPSMSSQIILPKPLDDREREIFAAIADRDKEIAERIEEIDDSGSLNLGIGLSAALNLLSNPGFEEDIDDWTPYITGSATAGAAGSAFSRLKCAKCSVLNAGENAYLSQRVTAPGSALEYVLQFWCHGDGSTSPLYSVQEAAYSDPISPTDTGITSTDWTFVSTTFTTQGSGNITPFFGIQTTVSDVYFDDILLAQKIAYEDIDEIVYQLYRQLAQLVGGW